MSAVNPITTNPTVMGKAPVDLPPADAPQYPLTDSIDLSTEAQQTLAGEESSPMPMLTYRSMALRMKPNSAPAPALETRPEPAPEPPPEVVDPKPVVEPPTPELKA